MSELVEMIRNDAEGHMKKSIEALKSEFIKIRTGRAHTSLLDHIHVAYYGSNMPINQVATITVIDSRTLGVAPWEKSTLAIVEKAIRESDLGLNPVNVGTVLRVPLPAMTEERRRDLVKVVRHEAENGRVAVRNIRRNALHDLKGLTKDKEISEDDERREQELVQKMTDKYIAQIDVVLAEKEHELMEV